MKDTNDTLVKESIELKNQVDSKIINTESDKNSLASYYSFLFENTTDSIVYCQMIYENDIPSDFIYLDVNPAFEKLVCQSNLKGLKATEIFPDIKSKNNNLFVFGHAVASTGIPQQYEFYIYYLKKWVSASVICPQKGHFIALLRDITSSKNTEQALKESEEKYKNLINHSPDIVYKLSTKRGGLFWSDRVKDILGYTPEEMQSTLDIWTTSIHPDDKDILTKAILNFEKKEKFEVEFRFKTKSGEWIWLNSFLMSRLQIGDEIIIEGHASDITARKKAELGLKISEEQYRTLANNTQDIINRFDRNYRHLYASPSADRITGINHRDYIGKTHRELGFTPEDCDFWEKSIQQVFDTKKANRQLVEFDGKTGKVFLDWLLSPEFDCKNNVVSVLGNVRDITEIKKNEEALRESEKKYKTLFENSGTGNVVIDIKGIYHNINKKAAEVFGKKPEQIIGKSMHDFMPLEIAEKYLRQNRELIEKGERREYEDTFTFRNEQITFNISDSPIKDEDGNYYALQSISHDITARKKAEIALKQSQEELNKFAAHLQDIREEERSSLSREIHDEIAQLLVVLKMEIGILKRKFDSGKHDAEQLYLSEEIKNLLNIIDKALKNTRQIMSELRAEELELVGFIESAKIFISNCSNKHNIKCNLKTSLNSINLKPQQTIALYRILQESLMNVVHHSLAKLVNVSIDLIDNKLILKIADNGVGFDLNNNFKKNSFGLTGIKERAVILNANIKIESKVGKGTKIILEMPYQS